MNKLSFRARALDAAKPMPIYMSEEIPDLPEYSAINRAVPQMPSGMEKEEECEHHLQRAIVTGLIIPTPEVINIGDTSTYDRLYPPSYKVPRQLIHMQPFTMEHDIPEYDMDSEDENWVNKQMDIMDITPLKFEEMMDRLEKNSGHSVVTQSEAKLLLKEDDDLIIAVYDYWLNKRLKTQTPLIPCVKTETLRGGNNNNNNNPYLAFRRRTEKMQTRKNRKNDETSYEKMVKLKRDLSRALTVLELVKRRENTKRENLHLTIEVFEKRFQAGDFSGQLLAEVSTMKHSRPAFAPLFANQYGGQNQSSNWVKPTKEELTPRKEKRQYKRRKHKNNSSLLTCDIPGDIPGVLSSGDDDVTLIPPQSPNNDDLFIFQCNKLCSYQAPVNNGGLGNWPWCSSEDGGMADKIFRYSLTSVATPKSRCVGFTRRRLGRGGRVLLDRAGPSMDDYWATMDFTVFDNTKEKERLNTNLQQCSHYRPAKKKTDVLNSNSLLLQVEDLSAPKNSSITNVQLDLGELFPSIADIFNVDSPLATFDTPLDNSLESQIASNEQKTVIDPLVSKSSDTSKELNVPPPLADSGVPTPLSESDVPAPLTESDAPALLPECHLTSLPEIISVIPTVTNSLVKHAKSATVICNTETFKRNVCKGPNNERKKYARSSVFERWGRIAGYTEPIEIVRKTKTKVNVTQTASNEMVGCSLFKTKSNDLKTSKPCSLNTKQSANLELTDCDILVSNDLAVNNVTDTLTITSEKVSVPSSLIRESPVQFRKPSASLVNSLLKQSHASAIKPQGQGKGLGNGLQSQHEIGLPQGRVVHLPNSVVTYHKNKGSSQVYSLSPNLNINNKIISWIPTDAIREISGEFLTGAHIVTEKPKVQDVTKNGVLPTEVTL